MCNYWTNFAKTGDPNGSDADGSKMPEWTPYTAGTLYPMLFADKAEMDGREKSELLRFIIDNGEEMIGILKFKV